MVSSFLFFMKGMRAHVEEYKPNSFKYKNEQKELEEKKVEKVVTGSVRTKKPNVAKKMISTFISEDAKDIKSHIMDDVIIPTIKDLLMDTLGMLLGRGGRGTGSRRSVSDKVSYAQYYSGGRYANNDSSKARPRFDMDDIIFETRADAEALIDQINDMIDRYGVATVADLYDAADLTQPYTSNKYGWTNFRSAEVIRIRDGYIIKLPKIVPLD